MGYIRKLNSDADPQTFPSAKFIIVNGVPATQCSAPLYTSPTGTISIGSSLITKTGLFGTSNLALKSVTVTAPPGDTGTFIIKSSSINAINTNHTFTQNSNACNFYLHDPPSPPLSLTNCTYYTGYNGIFKTLGFATYTLNNCKVTVLPPVADAGTYNISSNSANELHTDKIFNQDRNDVSIQCYNPLDITLTRTLQDFINFIRTAGYRYTIKAGNLYTDCPEATLQTLCPLIWNPVQ